MIWLAEETWEYLILSFYLYVCFASILLYTDAVLRTHGVDYDFYGFAAVKALILAKFVLIGRMSNLGGRYRNAPLVCSVLYKSFTYLLFLVLLSSAEEIAVGFLHGRSVLTSMSRVGGGNMLQIFATSLLLWLILLPAVTAQELIGVFGAERVYQFCCRRRLPQRTSNGR